MTPFILDKEETVDEDEDHGENDHHDNHQPTVHISDLVHQKFHLKAETEEGGKAGQFLILDIPEFENTYFYLPLTTCSK